MKQTLNFGIYYSSKAGEKLIEEFNSLEGARRYILYKYEGRLHSGPNLLIVRNKLGDKILEFHTV